MGGTSESPTPDLKLFRDVFNASPIGMVVENLDGQPLFVNPAFCSFLGFDAEELCGKHCVDFSPAEDAAKDWALFQQLRAGSIGHYQMEKRYFRRDGSLIWGRLSISLLSGGPSPLVLAMVEDITEKKAAEESRFRHVAIVESSEDAIISKDLDACITSWNAGAERMFGYKEAEVIGQPITILIPPELRSEEVDIIRRLTAGDRIEHYETKRVTKTGKLIDVSLTIGPIKDSTGEVVGFTKIAHDITNRKRAEHAIKESEARFRLVADTAPVLIWMSGTDKLCSYFNKPWLDFTGRSLEQELGDGWAEAVHSYDLKRCLDTYIQSFDKREKFKMEYRLRRHDGEYRWILDIGVPRLNQDRSFAGYIGIAVDVTEQKMAEDGLRELNQALEGQTALLQSREELLRTFVRNVPAGVAMLDREMRYLEVSDRWCADYSVDSSQVLGHSHYEIFPEVPDRWKEIHRRALNGETLRADEDAWEREDGITWVRWEVRPWQTSAGNIGGIIIFAENVTRRKQVKEALRASEERLRLAQRAASIGTFEWNVQTGAESWTPELETMYGLTPGGFGGTHSGWTSLIHADDREKVQLLADETLKTGRPMAGEWRVVWPDRTVHWIAGRWQVLMDENGRPWRVVGVNIDVTERKRAEHELSEANERLRLALEAGKSSEELLMIFVKKVPVAVAMLDHELRYLQVSDRWCSDNGVEAQELLGRPREVFPEMPERWKEVNRRALQGETLRADEDSWESAGSTRWARWEVRPWRKPDGNIGGILVFAEDITERKRMEQTLSDMTRKLIESQDQERARIARELHDDIVQRLALSAVELGELQQSLQGEPPENKQRIAALGQTITEISTDLQTMSHELHSSKLEYLGLAVAARSCCREFAEHHKLDIDFQCHDVPARLPQEVSLCLFRVLQEALNNAVKYSGSRKIQVRLWETSGELHLTTNDSGKGFDLEQALQGAGLGLISMRERVRLTGGTITIDSGPNHGTRIHARVPMPSEQRQQIAG